MTRPSSRWFFALGIPCLLLSASCAKHKLAAEDSPDDTRVITPVPAGEVPVDPGTVSDPTGNPSASFEVTSPTSYVAKVKNLLTGLPPTDAEIQAVVENPQALTAQVDRWIETPEFREKTLSFFRDAFQQNQINLGMLFESMNAQMFVNEQYVSVLERSIAESFPRTAWQLVSEGRPFTETVTTERYMLTPPLMSLIAWLDLQQVNDRGQRVDMLMRQWPDFHFVLDPAKVGLTIEESLNPNSGHFMTFYDPQPVTCANPRRVFSTANRNMRPETLVNHIFGKLQGACKLFNTVGRYEPMFARPEFDAWRMVTIRKPQGNEVATPYYDLPKMRQSSELVTRNVHVGFFGTPAFFTNWATNTSNQSRVTMNQTLIVALGRSFDGSLNATPVSEAGLSAEHSTPGTECYSCHQTLDPMRQVFRQAYSLYYHEQVDPLMLNQGGVFAFDGVSKALGSVQDLAQTLATHPRFAAAWTQKLCYYANSAPCLEDDPEFVRIARAFEASNFNYKTLVRELFASPLVTGAAATKTARENGTTVSIARRNHFCTTLGNRLEIEDPCGLRAVNPNANQRRVTGLATTIPIDGYVRGSEVPVIYTTPNLFHRVAAEKVCRAVADQVVDAPPASGPSRYTNRNAAAAIGDLVHNLMGLTSGDPRAAEAERILTEHNAAVIAAGGMPGDALKSTFVLACLSPTSVMLGF